MRHQPDHIRARFADLRQQGQRHRDIAQRLGISEGALIAAHVDAPPDASLHAAPLAPAWPDLVAALADLGEVMALTRNAACVHEAVGVYRPAAGADGCAVQGEGFALRLDFAVWAQGFGVTETGDQGVQRSLQFFDADGLALHKVFLRPQSHDAAWAPLLARFAPVSPQAEQVAPPLVAIKPDAQIDVAGLRRAWLDLRDAQGFEAMLRAFGVSRLQALRLADARFAQPMEAACAHRTLEAAASGTVPLSITVASAGVTQTRAGLIHRVAVMGPWLNVLDPGFNLHLREDLIASAWVLKTPSAQGLCLSLELFDPNGNPIATLAGVRQPGKPEPCAWCALIESLTEEHMPCAEQAS